MRCHIPVLFLLIGALLTSCSAPAVTPTSQPTLSPTSAAATPTVASPPTSPPTAASPPAASPSAPTPSPIATATAAFPMTITDDADRQVTIAAVPERIVSIAPSNTEILFALGLGDTVVAVDQFSDYPPEAKQKTQVGSYAEPDIEQIVAASPNLVLATNLHVQAVVPALEARQITVVVINPENLDEVLDRITLVGRITGRAAEATKLADELRERIDVVTTKVRGAAEPRVFYELTPDLYTVGPGSFIDDLITRAGGKNVAADATSPFPQLSQEVLIQKDPEIIVLADEVAGETPEKVRNRPGWQDLRAVKEGRIVTIDPDLATRPGPRVVDGLEELARILHPDRFE